MEACERMSAVRRLSEIQSGTAAKAATTRIGPEAVVATTALFVEILVTGIQTSVLIAIVVGSWWDVEPVLNALRTYKEYAALLTTIILGAAYTLGILVDRLADTLFKPFLLSDSIALPERLGKMRLHIMDESEGMAKFLEYQRSRLRIARSTLFNLFWLIIAGTISLIWRSNASWLTIVLILGTGIAVFLMTLSAVRAIDKAQLKRLQDAYEIISEKQS